MDIHDILAPVRDEMNEVEKHLEDQHHSEQDFTSGLLKYASRFTGKRLRPALVLLSGKACGQTSPQHIDIATVAELLHTATLIHDDVIDGADMRRSLATINAKWGTAISILVGDLLLSKCFGILARLDSQTASAQFAKTANIMCEGELLQLHRRYDMALDEADYLKIIEQKTAVLCATCCRLGAIFAGAKRQVADALADYGLKLGIAFQIVDDCLDIVGQEKEMGKSLYTDMEKGKLTLPLIRLVHEVPANGREGLRRLLFPQNSSCDREAVVAELSRHDAVEYAYEKAREYVESAREQLACIPASASKDSLHALAGYVIRRRR
ncbi:MAG: polyprenyl synthetase family protein [Planctomycetes bacterium]|nr:polyprenyl synthetase family protein [Planctomycetota bacterium]MBM4078846.1 polyprenyl synthetase family protein [Planctomycetota bacterium]